MNHGEDIWTFANRIDYGPGYGTWLSAQQYRDHVAQNPDAKKFWREIHEAFATPEHPLEFVSANRRIEQ